MAEDKDNGEVLGSDPTIRGVKDAVLAGAVGGLAAKVAKASNWKIAAATMIPGAVIGGWEYLSARKDRSQMEDLMEERNTLKAGRDRLQEQLGAIEKLTHREQVTADREESPSHDHGRA